MNNLNAFLMMKVASISAINLITGYTVFLNFISPLDMGILIDFLLLDNSTA